MQAIKSANDDNVTIGGAIELNIVDKNYEGAIEEGSGESFEEQEEIENVNLEGRIVAKRIKELMSIKWRESI